MTVTDEIPVPHAVLSAALAAVGEAEQHLAALEAEHGARAATLAAVEGCGMNAEQIRALADEVRGVDPADLETAREAVLEARIAATEAERVVRALDLGDAQRALEDAEQHLRAAAIAAQEARWRVEAARGADLGAQVRDLRGALAAARARHEAARRRRLAALTGSPDQAEDVVRLDIANDTHVTWL